MNWKKVGIVIGHEYSTRVRKKSFILTTLLTPIGMALLICVPALIMLFSGKENQKVKVIDESGIVAPYLENSEHTTYVMGEAGETADALKDRFDELDYYAIVGISPLDEKGEVSVVSYSKEPLNMDLKTSINRAVNYLAVSWNGAISCRLCGFVKLPYSIRMKQVEFSKGMTHENTLVNIFLSLIEFHNLIPVISEVEICGPLEKLSIDINRI